MAELFLRAVNMSISASWIVPAIIVLRVMLKNAPKWINPVLWAIVGLRLILPFSIQSALSLIPSAETIDPGIINSQASAIHSGIPTADHVFNSLIEDFITPTAATSPLQTWINTAAAVWMFGAAAVLLYAVIRYIRLTKRVETAVLLWNNIYQSEYAASPFVLGVLRPRIYVPFKITDKNLIYVIAHEQAHIKRGDHWMKPIGFLLCCLHWFNPVLWVAYSLFCRDIEFACDERVAGLLSGEERADYSEALLSCSAPRKRLAALTFGEIGVKARVQAVLHYQKPKVRMRIAAVVICAITAVCFLTDPAVRSAPPDEGGQDAGQLSKQEQWHQRAEVDRIISDFIDVLGPHDSFHFEVTPAGMTDTDELLKLKIEALLVLRLLDGEELNMLYGAYPTDRGFAFINETDVFRNE